jgi:ribosomal protein S18 acetylase RimI-like enzyme
MTIKISKLESRHLPTVVRLLNEEYTGSYEFIPFNEERVLFQMRRRDLKVLVTEENGNVLGLIGTHLEERGEENIRWFATEKGPNRRMIEDTLLNEVEKKAKGETVTASVDEGSPRTRDWTSRGYALHPGWLRMSARLDGLKRVPEVAEGVKLRSLRPGEEENLVEVVNTGFGWERLEPGDLETWKSEDPPFSEDWVQVAESDGKIVSVVVAKPDTDFNKFLGLNRGYLGPATTLSEFRNKHLASALTAQAMNFLFKKGMDSVRLGTSEQNVSSITLLQSLGFHVDNVRKILRKKLRDT